MPWVQIGVALVGAYGSYQSSKKASKYAKRGDQALAFQREIYEDMRKRYEEYYQPLEKEMAAELGEGADLEGEANWSRGEFTRGFDQSLDESRRQQRRYGVDPSSMQAARFEEDIAYARAAGSADAANRARTEEDDRHFSRSLSFLGMGSGLQSSVAQGYGNQASSHYGLASDYASDAAKGAEAAASAATSAASAYDRRQDKTTPDNTPKVASTSKGHYGTTTTYETRNHQARRI